MADLQALAAFAARMGLTTATNDDGSVLAIARPDGRPSIQCVVRPERKLATMMSSLPFRAPPARFDAVARTIAVANGRTLMGAWVLNADTGQIYFRVTLPTEDTDYPDAALVQVIEAIVSSVDALEQVLKEAAAG